MYRYETHLHTWPVSKCGKVNVRENLEFYKEMGYDGVFITNHYLDGNVNIDPECPFEERIDFYFSDYEEGVEIGKELGIKVFLGTEIAYKGTDFLVYGLDKEWYRANPQILNMKKTEELQYMMDCGALVIQAHPFRQAKYIDHIRLFPKSVHGVEVINACRKDEVNEIAAYYAKHYGLLEFAGSDNHVGCNAKKLAGMCCDTTICSEAEFVAAVKNGKMQMFTQTLIYE